MPLLPFSWRASFLSLCLAMVAPVGVLSAADRASASDRKYAAAIVPIGKGDENGSGAQALVLTDRRTGRERQLLVSKWSGDFERNLTNLSNPLFSPDGNHLYFSSSDASPNSAVVHQFDLKMNVIRFVHDGRALRVIRTGPYQGYLLVQVHKYYTGPLVGSYNPVFVVRPDGHDAFAVPGSEIDDGELAIDPWLARKGWRAW